MKVIDLKVLVKEHGLRGYSKLKTAELITFLQNNLQPMRTPTWEPIDDRPRQPGSQEMDIFKQQEMRKIDHKSRVNLMIGMIG